MTFSIRPLLVADLETAADLLRSAFQRPGNWLNDLRFYHTLQPDGYFGAYQDGKLAGIVGAIIYSSFAYVGMMGVHQDFQRQGLGIALMQHLLTWLDEKKVPLIRLDASKAGQPLYEKFGFVATDNVYTLQRLVGESKWIHPPEAQFLTIQDLDLINVSDTRVFGANRSRVLGALLETYPRRAFMLQDGQGQIKGYLIAQEKRIGPWVMLEAMGAEVLLKAALSLPFNDSISVSVPGINAEAIALLKINGFEIIRTNSHMMYGSSVPAGQRSAIFGQASLSLG